ncbi:MAG: type IX secretion system membrane protein PorP/SprF [Bacteroidota bacterium]
MKRLIWLVLASVLLPAAAKAQHYPMFSQYMFNGLVINPAYTGSRDALSLTALYRQQWTGFRGAPRTQTVTAHSPLKNPRNNFGVTFLHDRVGVSTHTMAYGSYAYRIDLGERAGRLAFGLQGGLSLLQDRWTEIITDQNGDEVFSANSPTFVVPRVGFGVYYDHRRWYFGASVPFLLDYKNSDYTQYVANSFQYRPYMLTAGVLIRLNPDFILKPSILVKYLRNSPIQGDFNANLIFKDVFWIGASYRTGDAMVGMLEYQINPQFRIGYAFDYTITELRRYHNGSHEFMLRYEFGYKVKAMSPRYF